MKDGAAWHVIAPIIQQETQIWGQQTKIDHEYGNGVHFKSADTVSAHGAEQATSPSQATQSEVKGHVSTNGAHTLFVPMIFFFSSDDRDLMRAPQNKHRNIPIPKHKHVKLYEGFRKR